MTPPPIASPHSYQYDPRGKPPFRGLKNFVVADLFVLFLELFVAIYRHSPQKSWTTFIVGNAIYVPLWCLLLWYLWQGSGVARLIFCWANAIFFVLALLVAHRMTPLPSWALVLRYCHHAFLLFTLVWLQLPGVKAHFRREKLV